MNDKELRKDMKALEKNINDIPNIFDPCPSCGEYEKKACYNDNCRMCCWYYASQFKLKK